MNWLIEEVVGTQPVMFDVWRGDNLTLTGVDYGPAAGYLVDHGEPDDHYIEQVPQFAPVWRDYEHYLDAARVFEGEGMGEE